jgi:hypothetical protein
VEAAVEKKLHPDFDAPEYEEDDIDDDIESIHDEDESMLGENEEGPEDEEEPKAQEEPEDNDSSPFFEYLLLITPSPSNPIE